MSLFARRGRWITRPRSHECRKPTPRVRDVVGAVWQCRCGRRWTLTTNYLSPDGFTQHWTWRAP